MIGPPTEETWLGLLHRLQGSGYTREPDSLRERELQAVAKIAAMTSEALDAASQNLFLTSAAEALDLLERLHFLVGDARLTVARRRARLLAFAQAARMLVPTRLAHAFASYLGNAGGTTRAPTRDDAARHRASPLAALLVGRKEPAATSAFMRRDLAPVLERGLPARALSGGISTGNAVYGAALGESTLALREDPLVTVPAQTKARAAPLELHPGALVTREAWIEIQAMLTWKSHGFSLDAAKQGRAVLFHRSLAGSESVLVDGPTANGHIDWRTRLVQAWGTVTATDSADLTIATASEHVWLAPAKLDGGVSRVLARVDGDASDVRLGVDVSGNLVLTNDSDDARHCTLLLRGSPAYLPGTTNDTQPWLDVDAVSHDGLAELYRATLVSDVEPGKFAGVDAGALRRIVYTGGLTKAVGADRVRSVVLDTSEDWRHRYVLVAPLTYGVAATIAPSFYPHAGADGLTPRREGPGTPRLFYTGDGAPAGKDTVEPHQHPDALTGANVWLYADSAGNLCAEMKGASADVACCLMALIIATEQTNGASVVTPVPVHATTLQTLDLEQPQNNGCYAQGFQGAVPRYALTDPSPRAVPTCPPLGLISEGHVPPRPVSWRVRERLGARDDTTYEVRQKILGQRKRLVSIVVPPGTRVPVDDFNVPDELAPGVNDQMDFRDRFVWIEGRYASADITISAAVQASDEAATPFAALLYTGPYSDVRVELSDELDVTFEFSRSEGGYHSRLLLQNKSEAAYYVNATVECSGFVGLTDLRQYGVINAWMCSDEHGAIEYDENHGCSDQFKITGGSLVRG